MCGSQAGRIAGTNTQCTGPHQHALALVQLIKTWRLRVKQLTLRSPQILQVTYFSIAESRRASTSKIRAWLFRIFNASDGSPYTLERNFRRGG
jgi:hypothetical protein